MKRKSSVPFARGFKKPDVSAQSSAIGPLSETEAKSFDFKCLKFFRGVPPPTSQDDWLAQYNEEGQTYTKFLEETPWLSSRKINKYRDAFSKSGGNIKEKYPNGKIYLVELLNGGEKQISPDFKKLCEFSQLYLDMDVKPLAPITILDTGDNFQVEGSPRTRIGSRRQNGKVQLDCPSILTYLRGILPSSAICLVAVTMYDLYEESPDLFVAGLADGNSRVAAFSFARYDPAVSFSSEFWYEWKINKESSIARSQLIQERSSKVLVHEMCHLLGLDHCIYFACCMNGSGHLREDFTQPLFLCPVCLRKLQKLSGFDVVARYQGLANFYQDNNMGKEETWCQQRIKFLQQ